MINKIPTRPVLLHLKTNNCTSTPLLTIQQSGDVLPAYMDVQLAFCDSEPQNIYFGTADSLHDMDIEAARFNFNPYVVRREFRELARSKTFARLISEFCSAALTGDRDLIQERTGAIEVFLCELDTI